MPTIQELTAALDDAREDLDRVQKCPHATDADRAASRDAYLDAFFAHKEAVQADQLKVDLNIVYQYTIHLRTPGGDAEMDAISEALRCKGFIVRYYQGTGDYNLSAYGATNIVITEQLIQSIAQEALSE